MKNTLSSGFATAAFLTLFLVAGFANAQGTTGPSTAPADGTIVLWDFDAPAAGEAPGAAGVTAMAGATAALTSENAARGQALRVQYPDAGEYAGLHFILAVKDWSAHDLLVMDVFNPTQQMIPLKLDAADDRSGADKEHPFGFWNTRFGAGYTLVPGHNTCAFRYSTALSANEIRIPNFKAVQQFQIYPSKRPKGLALTCDNIRLVKASAYQEKPLVLLDFSDARQGEGWRSVDRDGAAGSMPVYGDKSPVQAAIKPDQSGDKALSLTFEGGRFPAAGKALDGLDLGGYQTFEADVTAGRDCVMILRIMFGTGTTMPATAKAVDLPRWEKAARLRQGVNRVSANFADGSPRSLKAVAFEVSMYNPHKGESISIDNVRLSRTAPSHETPFCTRNPTRPGHLRPYWPLMKAKWAVLGMDQTFDDPNDLGDMFKDKWVKPDPAKQPTVEQVEADFAKAFEAIRKDHPKAVMAVLRQGQAGYDPAGPEKDFAGWEDTFMAGHEPTSTYLGMTGNYSKNDGSEVFLRRRAALVRIDLSSIPKGATIHAARLILVRKGAFNKDGAHSPMKPSFFIAEACNRPWVANQENVFEYAKDKFWNEISGMDWDGDARDARTDKSGPDFLPLILAYGPSGLAVSSWDFTHAVRWWTSGKNANNGFCIYSLLPDYMDYMMAWTAEAKQVKNRPALMIVYEAR